MARDSLDDNFDEIHTCIRRGDIAGLSDFILELLLTDQPKRLLLANLFSFSLLWYVALNFNVNCLC